MGQRPRQQPWIGERFVGRAGLTELHFKGAIEKLQVRKCTTLADAILCATHPDGYFLKEERDAFRRVQRAVKMKNSPARISRWRTSTASGST